MGLPAHRAWWQLWHQPLALPHPLLVVGNRACAHLGHSLGWGLSKGRGMASNKCFLMYFLAEAQKSLSSENCVITIFWFEAAFRWPERGKQSGP